MADSTLSDPDESEQLRRLLPALADMLESVYSESNPIPPPAEIPPIPDDGMGMHELPDLWRLVVDGSSRLASPWMMGHMDTAAHPAAVLTDALVSGLNNNLLFRELSPFASDIEQALVAEFAARLGLPETTSGVFCSGGSLGNLTALFAACGGYNGPMDRSEIRLWCADSAHASIGKSAALLGLTQVVRLATDANGGLDVSALRAGLSQCRADRNIVVAVLGSTITGSVDDLVAIGDLCHQYSAWLHVDAVYGGALAYSTQYRHLLAGIETADSVAIGPQKWLYVPRLCALTLFYDSEYFESALGAPLAYSKGQRVHRGTWGLQGSRRADAITLWVLLQVLGRRGLARLIDRSIELTKTFHTMLQAHALATPLHVPTLNLQAFRWGEVDASGERLARVQDRLESMGKAWVSVAYWRNEYVLRTVLLNPRTRREHLAALLDQLEVAGD